MIVGELLLAAAWAALAVATTRGASPWRRAVAVALAIIGSFALQALGDATMNSVADVTRVCLLTIAYPLVFVAVIPAGAALRGTPRRIARLLGSPLVAAIATPIVLALYFFTPAWPWVMEHGTTFALSYPALFAAGMVLHAGLKGSGEETTSIAIAVQVLVSLGELVFDALPGIVMRFSTQVIGASHWAHTPHPLDHQSIAGAILWGIADVSDLPIIALVFVRWVRTDAMEARRIDALLDELDEIERGGGAGDGA